MWKMKKKMQIYTYIYKMQLTNLLKQRVRKSLNNLEYSAFPIIV